MSNERLKEIDILRATAFIFVVAQHTVGGLSNNKNISVLDYSILKFIYVIAQTAVPIFLFISGLSLLYVYSEKFDWKKYYIKRIKYVLIPYIVWSAINIYKLKDMQKFQSFLMQLVSGNAAFHLWYMGMILRLYLIFPIILLIAKKVHASNIKIRIIIFIGLTILYYYVSKYTNVIENSVTSFLFKSPDELQRKAVSISPVFWYLYFVLGMYLALNYEYIKDKVLKNKNIIFAVYLPLLVYAYLHEVKYNNIQFIRPLWILYVVASILVFYIISDIFANKLKIYIFMRYISDYSFAAYMAHVLVIIYIINHATWYYHIKNPLALGLLSWIITSLATPILISILAFVPYSQFITGAKNIKMRLGSKNLYRRFITWI
ncbi:acyltransferase [Clostridium thailandense]|uniref:Acyltransferase n=1 Tax=Clostridium thailandense TaxID=2794346 RepID=A0A949THS5_9CLOT|nr:acyltransferase [Clostridium thailandense]MBV7272490.1 acyltransferase [Clostridium thailandense]